MGRKPGRIVPKTGPAITKDKLLAIMHLRDGDMSDTVAIARIVGLFPCQVGEILRKTVEVSGVRCEKCGGELTCVPCVACRHRRQFPRYAPSPERAEKKSES